jgi:hypothetical protein
MKKHASLLILFFAVAAFVAGLVWLFQLRVGQGDVFPAYSSLRADPLGTRALYEALQELPGMQVERSLKPVKKLPQDPPRTLVLAGMNRWTWETFSQEDANALEAAVNAGSRLVVVFHAELEGVEDPLEEAKKRADKKEAAKKKADGKAKDEKTTPDKASSGKTEGGGVEPEADEKSNPPARTSPRNKEDRPREFFQQPANWARRWGVELHKRQILDRDEGALRHADAPGRLPRSVPWKSDLYFRLTKGADWDVVYTRGFSTVLLETKRGAGSIVLASDAYFLSNEAMQKARSPELLSWLIGGNARAVFMESHLGVQEDVGIAKLARRYGLAGAFFMLLLLAALFVWQRMALFVPPAPETAETALTYHPSAGLEALLRRALPAGSMIETCVAEWLRSARASAADKARVAAAAQAEQARKSPADAYNAIVRALRRR